jgi:hypothetical protein
MKPRRVLLTVFATLLAVGILSVLTIILMFRGTPQWYRQRELSLEQRKAAANSADQKLLDIYSWAASVQAREIRLHHGASTASDDPPIGAKLVNISDDELNSFIQSWEKTNKSRLRSEVSPYFSDGRVILQDGKLVLAGQSDALGTVVSAAFAPSLDGDGKLHLEMAGLTAGLLPVPQSAIASRMGSLKKILTNRLATYQDSADIDDKMTANAAASGAIAVRLLLDSLNGRASDSLICVPFDVTDVRRQIPVRLTAVKIDSGALTARLEPVPDTERGAIMDHITQPYDTPTQPGQ